MSNEKRDEARAAGGNLSYPATGASTCAVCGKAIRPVQSIVKNSTGRFVHDMATFTREERRALDRQGLLAPNHEARP